MDVRGYPTGPIDAKGAFTSEIDLPPVIKPGPLNTLAEVDRPHFVDQPGMRHKYLPLRHDPATGALLVNPRTHSAPRSIGSPGEHRLIIAAASNEASSPAPGAPRRLPIDAGA